MFEAVAAPEVLTEWLREEWEYCLATVPYGPALRAAWSQSTDLAEDAERRFGAFPPELRGFSAPFLSSLRASTGIPGFQGVVERSMRLVQVADRERHGREIPNVVAATLPTNERYAAVYEPHGARSWRVIALDWGFICGLWGLAVCFARVAPATRDASGALVIDLDPEKLAQAVAGDDGMVSRSLTRTMVPCILMSTDPPEPLPLAQEPARIRVTGTVFNALVFSVVAHEYAHLRLDHLGAADVDRSRRHQMEMEADGLALVYALMNPWGKLEGLEDRTSWGMAAAAQSLVLSFIGMLEMGDRMVRDLGSGRRSMDTHPPAGARLAASEYLLHQVLNLDERVKRRVNGYRRGFAVFADEIWNRSVQQLLEQLRMRLPGSGVGERVALRRADLRFL